MCKKILLYILYMVEITVLIFVCVDAVGFFRYGSSQSKRGELSELKEGWTLKLGEVIYPIEELPQEFVMASDAAMIFRQLPEKINDNSILAFENRFQDVQVKINGEERYTYHGLLPDQGRRMNTNVLCIVDLEEKDAGQEIKVAFQSPMKTMGLHLPSFFMGTESGLMLASLRAGLSSLVFSGIMLFFTILCIAMFLREKMGQGEKVEILAHTSLLMVLSSIWSIANCEVVHLCVGNDILLAYLSFNSFMLLPIMIPIFYSDVLVRYKKFLYRLAGVATFNFLFQNILNFWGKYQYIQMMSITYILLLFTIFALIGISIGEYTKEKCYYTAGFLIATIVFLSFYMMDVLRFFFFAPLDNARFFRYGVLAFIIIIVWICAKRVLCYVEVEIENRVYKELALRDVLTHLPNRVALEKCIESLEERGAVCKNLTVILMDVNGLKPVNDKSGHGAGDRLLCEAAKSIKEAFPEEKDAWYRLGGDEFVVLMTQTELSNEECQQRMQKATEKWKNFEHGPISISCGSQTARDVKVTKEIVHHLMQEADQIMYKNKIQYYQKKLNKRSSQEIL